MNCLICDSSQKKIIYNIDDYHIVQCKMCGFIYVFPYLGRKTTKRIYETFDYDGWISQEEHIIEGQISALRFLEQKIPSGGTLLDVGCAAGFLLSLAKKRGWRVTGVEPSAQLAKYAKKKYGVNVITGSLDDVILRQKFDAVTMFQVIEHTDPKLLVMKARNALNKGGYLVIQTPNIESMVAKVFGRDYSQIKPPFHIFYFSRKTLKRLVEKEGFRVVRMRTYEEPGLLKSILSYLLFDHSNFRTYCKENEGVKQEKQILIRHIPAWRKLILLVIKILDSYFIKALAFMNQGSGLEIICKRTQEATHTLSASAAHPLPRRMTT